MISDSCIVPAGPGHAAAEFVECMALSPCWPQQRIMMPRMIVLLPRPPGSAGPVRAELNANHTANRIAAPVAAAMCGLVIRVATRSCQSDSGMHVRSPD